MEYIIRKDSIEKMQGLAKTHYLNQNAQRINKSLGDLVGLKNIGFHLIEVLPGFESTEYHLHYFEEECIYILHGNATVTIDEVDYEVGAGFVGYPAGGLPHTIKNTGSDILRCIVVGQRLAHDVADYPKLGKRLYRHGQSNDLVDLESVTNPSLGKEI